MPFSSTTYINDNLLKCSISLSKPSDQEKAKQHSSAEREKERKSWRTEEKEGKRRRRNLKKNKIMAASSGFSMVFALCFVMALVVSAASASMNFEGTEMGWMMPIGSGMVGDEEFELDSESNRRILATRRYISYGALQRNSVPCSRRGQSYYNCRPGAQANPYTRGCSTITRCRS